MGKTIFHFVLILFLTFNLSCSKEYLNDSFIQIDISERRDSEKNYFYTNDSIIKFNINAKSVDAVVLKNGILKSTAIDLIKNYRQINFDSTYSNLEACSGDSILFLLPIFLTENLNEYEYFGLLKSLNTIEDFDYVTPALNVLDGHQSPTDKFFIKTNMEIDSFKNFIESYPVDLEIENERDNGRFLIRINEINTGFEGIDIANDFYMMEGTEYSQPSFFRAITFLSYYPNYKTNSTSLK